MFINININILEQEKLQKRNIIILIIAALALFLSLSAAGRAGLSNKGAWQTTYNAHFSALQIFSKTRKTGKNAEIIKTAAERAYKHDAYAKIGNASWYGGAFQGKRTAGGEIFDKDKLTAAHRTMPLPSYARVTNLKNGISLIVRVNDRGPYIHNRIIDVSQKAAQLLGYHRSGLTKVRVEYLGAAPKKD